MDPTIEDLGLLPAASQDSSHFPLLEPVSGATLFELETARRGGLRHRGDLKTGSAEIDEKVLLGGFERGQVVGVSAEEAEFGVLVGLHTVAHATVFGAAQRAAIITTLAPAAILPMLRDVIKVQVQTKFGPAAVHRQQEVIGEVRRCLELISVSRVFDVEGLWEVISEIETPPSPTTSLSAAADGEEVRGVEKGMGDDVSSRDEDLIPEKLEVSGQSSRISIEDKGEAATKIPPLPSLRSPPRIERTEIGDSEDDDEDLSLSPSSPPEKPPPTSPHQPPHVSSSPSPPPPAAPTAPSTTTPIADLKSTEKQESTSHIPDIILITHFSTLLTNLFTRSADNKTSAHTTLQLLSSHLRYLSRSPAGPLVVLLNTTSTSSSSYTSTTTTATNAPNPTNANIPRPEAAPKNKPLEPTLRSIFSPAPPPGAISGTGGREGGSRRHTNTKPAFGVTFAQFLDLHLLCTRVPRTRADAEALFSPGESASGEARYGWVVEVLLDELGVWGWDGDDGKTGGESVVSESKKGKADVRWTRRNREQRWGAVDVRAVVRLVDAEFQGNWQEAQSKGPVRVAAGFGGPPPRGL
ncbi:hypothetical protein F4781DRAFT_400390 [Annulohypoxylon bovei var. microspora]|nr:hypothetical protein F4781DRAFT_400390 [Annulohypoxylon bovei var. microspora]